QARGNSGSRDDRLTFSCQCHLGEQLRLTKQLTELRAFDDELKHHADMRITLDLDDGVKVNYGKFGTLLSEVKAITGSNSD
ncbi:MULTISPECIES: hypothetical protein, partial [unclassified Aeromonas]|uniref:hypothetical protein n=1 Tax=unclassified Aeromonas TaxID=257493 RepID=UPI0022E5C438